MAELELRFLGDLDVLRDGVSLGLPPSRKTRALLAYLALHPRGFRRDHLCDLFWEVPDDPRGALRWSLSKLRRLVDDPDRRRLVADRSWVRFDAADTVIDVAMLDALACSEFRDASLEELESAAARCRGEFLAGLDLPGLHDFHVWCAAERERIARARAGLLSALVARLGDEPDRALPYARTLVGLLPYDQTVRAGLIRMLMATGRTDEAEQHFRLGLRMNEEVGAPPSGALYQARRGMPVRTLETGAPLDGPVQTPADRPLPGASKLVGRDAEIRWLNDAFSRVTSEGRAAAVLLKGDAGIGKSCLLELAGELARGADAFVLEASAFEAEVARPFALWIDAFRRCEPGSGAELFDGVPPDRDRLLSALSERLTGEAERRPVVLIFDDLQWGDDSSAAALHYVTRMNRHQPLLAVLAARPDDRAENPGVQQALRGLRHDGLLEELRLGPLPPAAVRELIEMHAPTVDSRALSRECGGNPLMAIELARAGTAGASGGSLDELVRERLGRLDSSEQEVLRWAAVLAPRIDVGTLVRITGMDWAGVGDALERGERQAILLSTD
ncbi:MAG: AAA family ATPase, partial [Pseudomonadota bacterium]